MSCLYVLVACNRERGSRHTAPHISTEQVREVRPFESGDFVLPGTSDPDVLKKSKIIFASSQKMWKQITDVANGVFHKPA